MDSFDYIIVGSGAAGSVVAGRLAQHSDSICVLEAGPPDGHPFIRIPAGYMKTRTDPALTFQMSTVPRPATANRALPIVQGRTVGGGSSINGMLFVRGLPRDFDGWAALGCDGWSYRDILPYYQRLERAIGVGDERYRGRDGALPLAEPDYRHPLADAFMDSAAACGLPKNSDYNGQTQFGTGYFQAAIHRRKRHSAADAFLHPAVRADRVNLRTNAVATRIRFASRRAQGVDYVSGGNPYSINARRGVILAAGAIHTPKLLQLSGVGPADLLAAHGIGIVHNLPAVGVNLRDHYNAWHVFRARGAPSLNRDASGVRLAWQILKYFAGANSILGLPPGLCYAFGKTDPAMADPDFELTFAPASLKHGALAQMDYFSGMTCGAWKHRTESHGSVMIASADPHVPPLIDPGHLTDERDCRDLVAILRFVKKVFSTDPIAHFVEANVWPGPQVHSDDELLDFARRTGTGAYHLTGSCRMGPAGDMSCVVSPDLRVQGMNSLWIADASIMPTEPSGNTYAPTLMIAERASDLIRTAS